MFIFYDKSTMKKQILFLSTILINALTVADVSAQVSDEMRRFHKCYGIMVGQKVALNDPLWTKVKAGQISGTDACMQVFSMAKLDQNGEVKKGANGQPNDVGMKILASFLRFHKSTLAIADYTLTIGNGTDRLTRDVTDANEAVYQILYSVFGQNQQWSDTLTRDYALEGQRKSDFSKRTRSIIPNVALPEYFDQGTYITVKDENGINQTVPSPTEGVEPFYVDFIQTGLLYGLKRDTRENIATHPRAKLVGGVNTSDINEHWGGGAIGTQAYLIANLGRGDFNNGGSAVNRRWGKHVMEDFLCRTQPTLRTVDVSAEVDTKSAIAFRKGASCMACHATMDPISGATRNLRFSYTNNTGMLGTKVKFAGKRHPDMAAAPFPKLAADGSFYRRPADARVFYRSYNGDLIDESVTGIQSLGEALVQTNDFYVCAAKRYYQFLTGIEVNLSDEGDVNSPILTQGQLNQRNKVIELGMKLQTHQSIEALIREIISSPIFINPDKGV